MNRYFILLLIAFCWNTGYAQPIDGVTGNFSSDLVYAVRGKSASGKYENIQRGTPYFINVWLPATVILFNGKHFDNVPSKIDLLEHKYIYIEKAIEYEVETPVKEVVLQDTTNGKKYTFIHSSVFSNPVQKGESGWYLRLADGEAQAFKYISKKIEERKPYNSAITERSIEENKNYFLYYKNLLIPINRLKEIPQIIRSKEKELNEFIEKEGLKKLSDESLEKLINYNNSLL